MDQVFFPALVARENNDGTFTKSIEQRQINELPDNEVLIQVDFSSLNYKDALSASGNRGVTKKYPHTPGIDAVGKVVQSRVDHLRPDEEVIVSGYDLGMNTPGGLGRYIKVPAGWVMRKPSALSAESCMQIGTAGFTAAQCVLALQEMGVKNDRGPVLVSGATGGVGSVAVALLSRLGYTVVAVTGKEDQYPWLKELGAVDFLTRKQATSGMDRMLLRERWTGVVDTVGGTILSSAIKSTMYEGVVTCCGNAASGDLPLNVYPFILRGIKLIGIDSAQCPMDRRRQVWKKLSEEWDLTFLEAISQKVFLADVTDMIDRMLDGNIRGRIVVDLRENI